MKPLANLKLIISSLFSFGCRKGQSSGDIPAVVETEGDGALYKIYPRQKSIDDRAVAASLEDCLDCQVYTEEFVISELLDATLYFYEDEHGNQIEYLSSDGNAYLWYPGNSIILKGKWAVIENQLIAFSFQQGTYNPVTNEKMDSWSFRELEFFVETINGKREGDVFKLSQRFPRVLEKHEPIDFPTFEP